MFRKTQTQKHISTVKWLVSVGLVLLAAIPTLADSFIVTLTETTEPSNLFQTRVTQTNYVPGSNVILFQTQAAPLTAGGYHFTHWTLNDQRVEDFTGQSINPAPVVLTNNIAAVAHYVPSNQYTADTLVPDWYKIEFYNATNMDATTDSDGDGFNLSVEFFRGYHPRLIDQIVEGGVSRRRSSTMIVIVDTNLVQITASSDPFGFYNDYRILQRGTSYSFPAKPSYDGYEFIGWFVGTNRVDDPQGFSSGTSSLIVSNNTAFVAKFLPVGTDTDADGLSDGYELYHFGKLDNTLASNPSGDGFDIAVDIQRGYQPNVFNEIVEGGVSRRRSSVIVVVVGTSLVEVTATSDPVGLYIDHQLLQRGTNYYFPAGPNRDGYEFTGWFVGTNRVDDSQGFSSGNISLTVSNDTTLAAKFLPVGTDTDADGLSDGYELYYFGNLDNTPSSNPSGDGFNIATDIHRGYQPNVFNEIVEGGISRRRSQVVQFVPAAPDFAAQPASQSVPPGTDLTLAVQAHGVGPFTYQWRLNGVNIPGATGTTFTIFNAQPTNSGSYDVVVSSPFGATASDTARVVISSPALAFADVFAARGSITGIAGVGSGTDSFATRENGEPLHAAKNGSNSVWLSWTAPAGGLATFSTRGSGFDTLLGIYTGASVGGLAVVASDDDRAGYLNSEASFNAVSGTTYAIAVDGFAGSTGSIVLSWRLDVAVGEYPRIIAQPASQTVLRGDTASLAVVATTSVPPLNYQWYFKGSQIAEATNFIFTIPNMQPANVGDYLVRVANGLGNAVFSPRAFLEIGSAASQLTQDKFQDLLNPGGIANGFVGGKKKSAFAATTTSSGFVPVAAGTIDSQILNNTGATTSPGEPIHCGVLGGASRWFGLRPSVDGIFIIDTIGSSIDTVLAVYTNDPANLLTPLQFVSCDNDGAPDGRRSLVRFPARGGVEYLVAVDGVNGAQGGINLNWKLGVLPVANGTNTPSVIRRGNSITLNANILAPTPDLRYQWRLNGENLAGATNSTLLVIVDQAAHAGSYSVIASNFAGVATNNVAALTMEIPFLSVQPAAQSGTLRVQFESVPAQGVVLQSSSDLVTWIPVYTNAISSPMPFVDIQTTSQLKQFLRALPWP